MRGTVFLVMVMGLLLMAGCGGGGNSDNSTPTDPGGSTGGGASGGGITDTDDSCGASAQIDFVQEVTDSWYLWYDEMASVSKSDYDDPEAYLDALLAPMAADGRDPGFSFLTTITEDEARFTSGAYIGFGFRYTVTDADQFLMIDVFESGPAYAAGFRRGWELVAVDTGSGFETMESLVDRGASSEEVFGASELGVERGFRLVKEDEVLEVVVAKEELDPPALVDAPLLITRSGNTPVGYLNLRQFILSANDPLTAASLALKEAGVTDLVVDLRYNGGGLLSVADNMMDLLGGTAADGELAFQLAHNDKHADENARQQGFFDELAESVGLLRIAFITTGSSASASELVINSLAPHIEVVLVGSDTYGKAVGQYGFDLDGCDVRLRLVAFEIVNGEGQGGYYTGLYDTGRFTLCSAGDDYFRPFGDPEEASLKSALGWLNSGACPSSAGASALKSLRTRDRSGDPAWWRRAEWQPDGTDPFSK